MSNRPPDPLPDPDDLELSSYDPSSSTHPLLSSRRHNLSPAPTDRIRRPFRRRSKVLEIFRRWWKPSAALSLPFVLLFIYAFVHPYVPGLPPLPTVSIQSGSHIPLEDAVGLSPDYTHLSRCICGDTPEGARLCDIYGKEGLKRSRLFDGTGARVRRILQKGREGLPLRIGILGGSVSACHGVHPSDKFPQGDPDGPGCYTNLIREWFVSTFPESDAELLNGAIGGMDSSYYAFCGTHHIAPEVDLIILEFDVNDQADLIYQAFFDQLLRVLLEFPSQPAVIVLGAWSPQVAIDQGYGDPQIVHLPIAHYYDIPYISMKRTLFNTYLRFPESTSKAFYQPDMLHPNARGHRVLADLIIAYLESELCLVATYGLPVVPPIEDTIATPDPFSSLIDIPFPLDTLHLVDPITPPNGWEETFNLEPLAALTSESRKFAQPITPYSIPLVGLFTPLRDIVDPTHDPKSAKHLLSLVQPKMFCADANDNDNPLTPTKSDGWEEFIWNGEKHFWVSSEVGARIRVEIKVNAGRVAIYYFRSQHYNLGDARCWVDDNESGAVELAGHWTKQYNVAVVAYIDEKVTPGDHYVTCEIMEQSSHPNNPEAHHFRIVAVMAT